jgi:hypothetical protein
MTKQELRDVLHREGFRESSFDLDGGLLSERYTLARDRQTWSVYYSERGLQTGKRNFATESDACEYLLNELRQDPTTRR